MQPTFGVTVTSLLRIGPLLINITGSFMTGNKRRKTHSSNSQLPSHNLQERASAGAKYRYKYGYRYGDPGD